MDIRPKKLKDNPEKVKASPVTEEPAFTLDLPPPSDNLPLPRKKNRRLWWLLLIPVVIIVLGIIGVVSAVTWYSNALQPLSTAETTLTLQVESGATVDQVGHELEQKGLIKSGLAFSLYMKLNNKAVIKTGTYYFAPNQSVSEIVQWLNDGRVSTRKVTVLPGKTLVSIRQGLIDDGFAAEAVDAALAKKYTHPLLTDKPDGTNLEGYIFPETYYVTSDSTVEQLLVRTFDEFQKHIEADGLRAKLTARGFNLYQGITLASIVAKEVTNAQDQRQVAQVFELRLSTGMVLGSDVTYHYGASLLGVEPSAALKSPYNTRINAGLPPGPIANFNMGALQAVVDPSPGTYLYFVAGDDGVTYYGKTFEEHQQNIDKYCHKLCAVD